ncbi:MAG: DUF4282 domain-containing protein [Pseudomonas sp.]
MKDLLFFESMVTPKILVVLYWLSLIAVIVSGLVTMFTVSFWIGLGTLVGGVIGVRVWCELIVVAFKIHENLKRIADRQQ